MKLLALKADGFGPLRGTYTFDPERVTVAVGENELGKSSLLAAISAALYGLDDDKRTHRVLTPRDRWRPWDGGSFRVELELDVEDTRYTVRRDFDKDTTEVWNADGREVTSDFRRGKDAYPVGAILLGLDEAEWEKCAFVRQNDLAGVVPGDEKGRRASTLSARLENAADTHVGDTNATEAIRVIETAASSYTCDELGSTMKVENIIKALEAKHGMVETEVKKLEHDFREIAGPLEELARRGEDERSAREQMAMLDAERHATLAGEVRRQIAAHEEAEKELDRLRREADDLASVADLPEGAEAELRETIARYEEAQRNLEALEARRRDEQSREHSALEAERKNLQAFEAYTIEDADRFVALAAELRRIGEADSRLKDTVFSQREALASRGYEPERVQELTSRFDRLPEAKQKLLRGQAELALGFQTEVAALEQARTESTEILREIDAQRNAMRVPGWFLFALGLGGAVAGVVVLSIGGLQALWMGLLGGGLLLVLVGGILLTSGSRKRADDREQALRRLSEAQRKLNQIRQKRAESEVGLNEMCQGMGYRDPVELMREWNEYVRLMDDSGPVLRAQENIAALDAQRHTVLEEVKVLLEKSEGGSPDPAHLEKVAASVRHLWAIKQRLQDLDQSWSWIDDEKRVAEAAATGLKERAVRILQSAGLAFDPERPWVEHVADLSERLRGRSRRTLLVEELIPQAEKRLLSKEELADKHRQIELLETEQATAPGKAPRSQVEIERDVKQVQKRLQQIQDWRTDLRVGVEETWRRHHREHPEKQAELARLARALERARRFHRATNLAKEAIQKAAVTTHRRWAEHLNQRVRELLEQMGSRIADVRFGDDLDFSIRHGDGPQVTRGKAVQQLSSGAQDQLHLAVRLAISEFLSRGRAPLPLLIDDAFATSDDDRAAAGMKLLAEHFAATHQVIMVTCQRARHATLASADPALYESRVQMLDLRQAERSTG